MGLQIQGSKQVKDRPLKTYLIMWICDWLPEVIDDDTFWLLGQSCHVPSESPVLREGDGFAGGNALPDFMKREFTELLTWE